MQLDGFKIIMKEGLQEVITFGSYLSKTYGSGDVSLDGLAALTFVIFTYALLSLFKHLGESEGPDSDFDEAVGVISEALDVTAIQISEMRYLLLTEFDRMKREVELVKRR